MSSTTSGTYNKTKYMGTTKANYQDWKRDLDAVLSSHPDKLLTVVQDGTLAKSVQLKLKMNYKTLGEAWNDDTNEEYVNEYDSTAYHIIITSISCTTTLKTIEREFGEAKEGQSAYARICGDWTVGDDTTTGDLIQKDKDRAEHIRQGAQSGSLNHMTAYVETLLAHEKELESTEYKHTDAVITNHVLDALSKHDLSYVRGFKGTHAGNSDWNKDFGKTWKMLKNDLKDADTTNDGNAHSEATDILATKTKTDAQTDVLAGLLHQVSVLTTEVKKMQGERRGGTSTYKPCTDCGFLHPGTCVGKALSKGTITVEEAAKTFSKARDPKSAALAAQAKYETHQGIKKDTTTDEFKPRKTVNLCVTTTPSGDDNLPAAMKTYPDDSPDLDKAGGVASPTLPESDMTADYLPGPNDDSTPDGLAGDEGFLHPQVGVLAASSRAKPERIGSMTIDSSGAIRAHESRTRGEPASGGFIVPGQTPDAQELAPSVANRGSPQIVQDQLWPRSENLTVGDARAGVLKFDTQAEDTILSSASYFPDGVNTDVRLELTTITTGGPRTHTRGCGTACVLLADGTRLVIKNAHLYPGNANVVATRKINATLDPDVGMRLPGGDILPFDAGYCAAYITPATEDAYLSRYQTTSIDEDTPRHPETVAAILATGVHFGGVTGGARSTAGNREHSAEELGQLYKTRTALGARQLKALPDTTNAPTALSSIPQLPSNDHDSLRANMRKIPTKARETPRTRVVCFDLQGPFEKSKHGNNRYCVNFYVYDDDDDEHELRQWHLDFLKTKDEFPDRLTTFLDSGDYRTYQLFTDNEAVLNSATVKRVLKRRRMKPMRNSCEYEPWQNPAERPWQTLSAGSREFQLRGFGDEPDCDPETYWPYTHQQVADVHNATHGAGGAKGRITHLRTPFCLAYARVPPSRRTGKLAPQAEACIHLGYSRTKPGYVLEVIEGPRKGKVITSSQVKFRESVFPMRGAWRTDDREDAKWLWDDLARVDDDDSDDGVMPDLVGPDYGSDSDSDSDDDDDGALQDRTSGPDDDDDDGDGGGAADEGASRRNTRSTAALGDWRQVYTALDKGRADGTINVYATRTRKDDGAPTNFRQIAKIPDIEERNAWYRAHYSETDGLFDRPDVLRAIPTPPSITGEQLLHLHTIYTVKKDGRRKARTVLGAGKDRIGELGASYGRTYSPTARETTLRTLCALAATTGMRIRGGDITQAYAQADWPAGMRKLHSHMPSGYHTHYDGIHHCCEVGNLYGHPVAGRNWYKRLVRHMLDDGFKQSKHDPCCFIKTVDGETLYVIVYVDDIIRFCTWDSKLDDEFAQKFSAVFDWTDFGTDLHDYLAIRMRQTKGTVELDMQKYIEDMADEFFPGGTHHAYTVPADTDLPNVVYKASVAKDETHVGTDIDTRFRRITMKLLYLGRQVRPDIAIAIALLTRVQAWPTPDLLLRAERVLIYAIGTKHLKLTYTTTDTQDTTLHMAPRVVTAEGAADSTFALAHSTSGYVFKLANAAISWIAKKQDTIALSPYEAEIVAGNLAACEGVGLRGFLEEIGHKQTKPTTLYMDNSAAIDLAHDPVRHEKAKHIARKDLFIRELVENRVVNPVKIHTSKNVADALTKPLEKQAFQKHRSALLGHG
jgi:hypothetical protein